MKFFNFSRVLKALSKTLNWFVGVYKFLKSYFKSKIIKIYPSKETINLGNLMLYGSGLFLILALISSFWFSPEESRSLYNRVMSASGSEDEDSEEPEGSSSVSSKNLKGTRKLKKGRKLSGDNTDSSSTKKRGLTPSTIKYAGTQVLVRKTDQGGRALPVGTNFIGRLLTDIDTRMTDNLVRVLLPFGAKFKDRAGLPAKTLLLGMAKYSGHGKRLFLKFHIGVLPSGEQFKLQAQAMDSKDFSIGLLGKYHSAFGNRVGATLGFAFLSGASDVMQEREALGEGFMVSKKANLKNAMLGGLSEFSKTEGALQLQEVRGKGAYVTLPQGKELIVTLTETFNKGGSQ